MAYEDLLKDTSESKDDGNYFLVTITDLDLGTEYPLQFRWKNKNGTLGAWSAVKTFTTEYATLPSQPDLGAGDVVGGAGYIKITWNGNTALSTAASNFDRVNIHISGAPFGDGTTPSGFFKEAGTQTFTAPAGVYIVQLKILTVNGAQSLFSTARTITVTAATPTPESSVTPSTPTVSSVLGAIQLSWNGKTSSGGDQPYGFNAAKVYVGTSAGFTPSSSNQVDVLNFANGQNTLNIGVGTIVNGVALAYGTDYYIKIATTNGTDTSTAVSATGNPVRVGQVTSGDIVTINADKIATGTLSAGSTITVGSTSGKHIKLSGTGDPFIIYGSGGTSNPVLSYNGTKLTVVGDGTFTGDISGASGTLTNALNVGTISSGEYPFSVSSSGVIRAISGKIGGLTLAADAIQNTGDTFRLDSSGTARFGSASTNAIMISPTLGIYHSLDGGTSANGYFTFGPSSSKISGWTINTDSISSPSGNVYLYSAGKTGDTTLRIQAGSSGQFKVYDNGSLTATSATITGEINATSGYIGSNTTGWSIYSDRLESKAQASIQAKVTLWGDGYLTFGTDANNEILYDVYRAGDIFQIAETLNDGNGGITSVTNIIKTETSDSTKRIFIGQSGTYGRQTEVAKPAQISGTGTTLTQAAATAAGNVAYRSGGLRNMYTVSSGGYSSSLYPSAENGDVLLVYTV